jgi:hypothetical protein
MTLCLGTSSLTGLIDGGYAQTFFIGPHESPSYIFQIIYVYILIYKFIIHIFAYTFVVKH